MGDENPRTEGGRDQEVDAVSTTMEEISSLAGIVTSIQWQNIHLHDE